MKTVYLVFEQHIDDYTLQGVFKTEKEAKRYIERRSLTLKGKETFNIEDWEVSQFAEEVP